MPADLHRGRPAPEVAEIRERFAGRRLEDRTAERSLEREGGDLGRLILDRHVEPGRVEGQPAVLRVRGGPAEHVLVQAMHGPVIDDLAELVAPRGVEDLPDGELRGVTGDDPVDEAHGVRPGHAVLEEGADIDQGGRLADRVVLDVVGVGVDGGREVARPLAPLHLPIEGRRPAVERGPGAHAAGRPPAIGFQYAGFVCRLDDRSASP